jgi:hypothetical protein
LGTPQFTQIEAVLVPLHTNVSLRHARPVPVLPPVPAVLQQGSPGLVPQVEQMPLEHLVPEAVQAEAPVVGLVQHAWPGPPQVPHAPFEQTPPPIPTHAPPGAMQMPATQHPPPVHELPSQQLWPGLPQVEVAPPLPPAPPPLPPLVMGRSTDASTAPPTPMLPPLPIAPPAAAPPWPIAPPFITMG